MTQTMHRSSAYLAMPDGVSLAIDTWRAAADALPGPVLLLSTRYWRALDLRDGDDTRQGIHGLARFFTAAGYVVVNVDARGSGASFGTRSTEWSDAELHDLYSVIEWITQQDWCNGHVAAHGYSYGGNTSFLAAAAGHPALKIITPQFADIDLYAHNLAPGGVVNRWLRDAWGVFTAALDRGDVAAVAACLPGIDQAQFIAAVRGPGPVADDADRLLLQQALAEHQENFNMGQALPDDFCADDAWQRPGHVFDVAGLGIAGRRVAVQASQVPIHYWAGWSDAGTAQGALELFEQFDNPMRVVIGPWNHGRRHLQDPLGAEWPKALALTENYTDIQDVIDSCLATPIEGRRLDFHTLGRNEWRSTDVWPLPRTQWQDWWLGHEHGLTPVGDLEARQIHYRVEPAATTGRNNRWHTQIGCKPVHHENRREEDRRLLVFDSAPLEQSMEITGSPVAHLMMACDQPDAHVFVYLEAVLPSGDVRLLSEGCLRLAHRAEPRRFSRSALLSMPLSGSALVSVPLLPLSIELSPGMRLRVAISGADADTFVAQAGPPALFTLQTGGEGASRISLPVMPRLHNQQDL